MRILVPLIAFILVLIIHLYRLSEEVTLTWNLKENHKRIFDWAVKDPSNAPYVIYMNSLLVFLIVKTIEETIKYIAS